MIYYPKNYKDFYRLRCGNKKIVKKYLYYVLDHIESYARFISDYNRKKDAELLSFVHKVLGDKSATKETL